jgi:Glycosyl hydrolase family 63 C-terminal domain
LSIACLHRYIGSANLPSQSHDPTYQSTAEDRRLDDANARRVHWWRWGPYLSERQWGTVREDYSPDGDAWNYFPHEHARSRAYRWGEDGIAGLCDRHQRVCFALAFWNERDEILKERLFGLTNLQGNHGEDVKEYYFYLDALPSSAYLKYLYKYPQSPFPYQQLIDENARRSRLEPEFELLDTKIFDQDRYFDIYIEYAKQTFEEVLIRITAINRGPDAAPLRILPTWWFRNKWSWNEPDEVCPSVCRVQGTNGFQVVEMQHHYYGQRWMIIEGSPELLFTENETNDQFLFGAANRTPYVKDAFHRYIIHGERAAVNPAQTGTKMAAHFPLQIAAGASATVKLRMTVNNPSLQNADGYFGSSFDETFMLRQHESDEFYARFVHPGMSDDAKNVQRQAFSGLLWNKQSYHYDVQRWLDGDPGYPPPPPERRLGRNHDWTTLRNADVLSMPDKWEYPWYASWDLAFHCMVMALIDSGFAKRQLVLLLREWYMHPSGKVPAYEWCFDDANPPVLAAAAFRVYQIDRRITGHADRPFLERVFQKLLMNFTWWVNRTDPEGLNIFEAGFLGLDNIGIFDRSHPLPGGHHIEQSDSTSWMMAYSLSMMSIALELARENPVYEDLATKFIEHCVYISDAMNKIGGTGLWDEQDGFYYDVLKLPSGDRQQLRVRSMVGLIPLFAVRVLEPQDLEGRTVFLKRMQWFLDHHANINEHIDSSQHSDKGVRRLVALVNKERLVRVLRYMLDENEFLSPHGIRSLSKYHAQHPYMLEVDHTMYGIQYEPAESESGVFGGNSNWRGPVWVQMNVLIIEALQRYDYYYGDSLKVECPTGSGQWKTLWEVSQEISRRISRIFLRRDDRRAVYGGTTKFQQDPHWRDLILFYEYFHGDNGAGLGASHQTGWTALVAKLLEQSGE